MIELYGSPTPSTYTIAIMLEEVGLNYSVFPIKKNNSEQLELEFLKQTPNNIFPVILDREGPDNKPLVIFEPSAILLYLAEKSGQLMPIKSFEKFDVLQWLLFENSKIGPTLGNTKHFMYHAPEEVPYAVKRFNNEAKRIFSIIENQLSENDYIAGDYSIADIATYPWIKEYERYGLTDEQVPSICAWLSKLDDRSAVHRGFEALVNLKD
ncbi:MAG: glutathione binding-like protein [Gammaproteobacteria bacterium]|nr:glutathione binding-like protein [Gammaproteobacteria bacterium]